MDTLDMAILRQFAHPGSFQWNVRLTNKEVGDAVGVDEETVRQRVRRLEEKRILTRWSVALHPELLGRTMVRVELPALSGPTRPRALEGLAAMGFAYHLFDFYGGRLAFVGYAPPGAAWERQLAVLTALWGAPPSSVAHMELPPPTVEPTRNDWKVVAALREDARATFEDLASRAGLSERTVRRSVERLVEGRALWLSPVMEMERAEHLISAAVRVFFRDPSKRGPVDARIRQVPGIVFSTQYPAQSQMSYGATRLADVEELRHELAAMEGVERVETDIMLRRMTVDSWMDEEIARRLKDPPV